MAANGISQKPKVLIKATQEEHPYTGIPPMAQDILGEHFDLVPFSRYKKEPELRHFIVGAITNAGSGHDVWAPIIHSMPSIRVICSLGAGFDHLVNDYDLYRERRIQVGNTPDSATKSTADFTFALLMASARDIISAVEEATGPEHTKGFKFNSTIGSAVAGATIGIVGMGRIGYEVARRATGFDMTVLYHNRMRRTAEEESSVKATYYSDLTKMVPLVDYLVICCPLTPDTHHLINRQVLNLMKKSATLVNTARGSVVDTEALVEILKEGSIRGAALDVTDPEPLPDGHPLLTLSNALITAHRGSCDAVSRKHTWQECCSVLKAVLIDNGDIPSKLRLC